MGSSWTRKVVAVVALAVAVAGLAGCLPADVNRLSSDQVRGRDNLSPGSLVTARFLLDSLEPIATGIRPGASGDAAYTQKYPGGANVLAVIPGTDKAGEYVMVGAHYDHLGTDCRTSDPKDHICNGATDNAGGVAVALDIARNLAANPGRRSVIIALWDGEEDGLVGSRYYAAHPIVPLSKIKAYVNYDIQGANLLPSLRTSTFALGTETGGSALTQLVTGDLEPEVLQTSLLSIIFGQGRSDHVSFTAAKIPTVFFTDSTGPCYHTAQDEASVVDRDKLAEQAAMGGRVVRSLADRASNIAYVSGLPLATFADAQALNAVVDRAWADRARFSSADQATVSKARDDFHRIVADGAGAFDSSDVSLVIGNAANLVSVLTHGPCDGFLAAN
ncbi:M28 family peptidase [Aquihabitans sp. G128]|uniref:M28 family metallopeptidase n=1 Tax=Aquihabitans sp. G128 TaxID=2849779 RepID=UPI001C246791|nr:M28 family peptidase [Aquihabitans sp. G128]QXC62415.1 M28 family peptidase [Aquihabitans sp. G128]